MKDPEPLAASRIEATHITFDVAAGRRVCAAIVSRTHDDDVVYDRGRCIEAHARSFEIELLIEIQLQVDDPALTESGDGTARRRIE